MVDSPTNVNVNDSQTQNSGSDVAGNLNPGPMASTPSNDVQPQTTPIQTVNQPQVPSKPVIDNTVNTRNTPNLPANVQQPKPVDLTSPAIHPHAQWLRGAAETLIGGKRYKTIFDPVTGESHQQPIKLSNGDIGMAIAATLITGAMSGLQARGPNHNTQALALGAQSALQLQKNRQEQEQQNIQQQTAEMSRKAMFADNNFKMYYNAIQMGRLDKEDHDSAVASYAEHLQDIKDSNPELIGDDHVSEADAKDLKKYPMTEWERIPDSTIPRIDPATGEPIKGKWDNTYTLVKRGGKMSLVDDDGNLKPVVRDAVAWGLPQFPQSLATNKVSPDTKVNEATLLKAAHTVVGLNLLQSELNSFAKSLGIDPVDLKTRIKDDPSLLSAVEKFQKTVAASTQPDLQIDAMRQNPKALPYVSKIMSLFGPDNLEQFKDNRLANVKVVAQQAEINAKLLNPTITSEARGTGAKFGTPNNDGTYSPKPGITPVQSAALKTANGIITGEKNASISKAAGEESAKNAVDRAETERIANLIADGPDVKFPTNWFAQQSGDINETRQQAVDARKYLASQGAPILPKFDALYAAGHDYAGDFHQVFPSRISAKTGQTDAETATDYIRKYINPSFDSRNFDAGKKMLQELSNPSTSVVINAGTASQHLNLLRQAAKNLNNNETQLLNKVANSIGAQVGKDNITTFKAINEQVNNEVAKAVAGGGQSRVDNVKENRDKLNSDQSPEQIDGVIRAYIGLMAGRLGEVNDEYRQFFPRPMHVSDTTTRLFQQYGAQTPWTNKTFTQVGGPPMNLLPQDGSIQKFKNGQYWKVENGNPVQVDQNGNPIGR